MNIYEANEVLSTAINFLESGYTEEQWTKNELINALRYTEAEKVLDKVKRAIDENKLVYEEEDWEEMERLNHLMYTLERKIERDENYFEYKNNFLSELNMDMNIKIY